MYIPIAILYFTISQDPALKVTNKATTKLTTQIIAHYIIITALPIWNIALNTDEAVGSFI